MNNLPFLKKTNKIETVLPTKGGIVVGYKKIKGKEKIYFIDDDMHSIILGATRSGKTRSILLQSICFTALSGESMLLSDPKGEIFDFVSPYLKSTGMEVVALDFKNPLKSSHYNFLQPIINAVKDNDIPKAVSLIWDLTSSLVPETKGEPIWNHGEASIISGSIMSVVFDNMNNHDFQNLTNVYYFINYMCKPAAWASSPQSGRPAPAEKGELPLNRYIEKLKDEHPAKALFGVSLIAPSKTRGSFFTSALATLRLFTDPNIYSMTCKSDFELTDIAEKRQALFIILPDAKKTYYGLASLFVEQLYIALSDHADTLGGRLKRRVNFVLEEFGNFTKISLTSMLTVGAGRGIRFNIVVQSFSQIEEKYGKEQAETVKDNAHCLIYLRSENPNTNAEISKRLGKYTTSSYGLSNSTSSSGSSSASMNLIARDLLMPEEINKIARPYLLVILSGNFPAIMQLPDFSKWYFNTMAGMGDKIHNITLRLMRQNMRKTHICEPLKLWGIWNVIKAEMERDNAEQEKQSPQQPSTPEQKTGVPNVVIAAPIKTFNKLGAASPFQGALIKSCIASFNRWGNKYNNEFPEHEKDTEESEDIGDGEDGDETKTNSNVYVDEHAQSAIDDLINDGRFVDIKKYE